MVVEDWIISLIGGAIVASFIELIYLIKRTRQRKIHLKIICDYIDNAFLQIKNVKNGSLNGIDFRKSEVQFSIFRTMLKNLNLELDTFQNSFKPTEILKIKNIINDATLRMQIVKTVNRMIDEKTIFSTHQELKNLEWLSIKDY